MRRAAKRDAAEKLVVETLEACGATVWRMNQPVDLLIYWADAFWLAEVKTGKRVRKDQPLQADFCRRFAVPYLRTPDDVRAQMKIWRERAGRGIQSPDGHQVGGGHRNGTLVPDRGAVPGVGDLP